MTECRRLSNICVCVLGFSLKTWMTARHFVPGSKLPEYAILQLVKDLGVAGYLQETPCDKSSSLYSPAVHGWKQGEQFHFFIMSIANPGCQHTELLEFFSNLIYFDEAKIHNS